MNKDRIACIILAAGQSTRMKSDIPKPLHKVAGFPIIKHVISTCEALGADLIIPVIGPNMQAVEEICVPHRCAIQTEALGTGHATLAAKDLIQDFDGDVLILFTDTPLITVDTLQDLIAARHADDNIGIAVSGMRPMDPGAYGRLVLNDDGTLDRIVEFKDCSDDQKQITLCNGGVMCVDGTNLVQWLEKIENKNASGEYYLVDLPAIASQDEKTSVVVEIPDEDVEGINTRADLCYIEEIAQDRLRAQMLNNGVTLIDPATVHFSADTQIGRDTVIHPNVIFGPGVVIENSVEIKAFTYIEHSTIRSGAKIGPHAHLRGGSEIGENVKLGTFVETKNTVWGEGAKANHLSYIGDAEIGEHTNIGAGSITANYDGFNKHRTTIGKKALIGADTIFVAPVEVGDGAITGAGSTITDNVPDDSLAIGRSEQVVKKGWAKRFRDRMMSLFQSKAANG